MRRLKIILNSNVFIVCLVVVVVINVLLFNFVFERENKEYDSVVGVINHIIVSDYNTSIDIDGFRVILDSVYDEFKLGETVLFKGKSGIPEGNSNFNLFNYKNYLRSRKIYYLFYADSFIVKKESNFMFQVKNKIVDHISTYKSVSYLNTFILGDTSLLEDSVYESYQKLGVNHLFAISGMHITLISGLLVRLLKRFNKSYLIVIVVLMFYAFLTSFSVSVLRSVFLFTFIYLNKKFKFNVSNTKIIVIIASLFLIYNPYLIHSISFKYSFIISFYLILFSKYLNKSKFYSLFMVSFIAFLVSIPISINNFFEINLLTVFYNLMYVPLITYIIFPFSLIVLFISKLDFIFYNMISLLESISLYLSEFNVTLIMRCVPFVFIVFYYFLITKSISNFFKKKYGFILFLMFIIVVHNNINMFDKSVYLTMIDQTCPIMIQRLNNIFQRNPLISIGI